MVHNLVLLESSAFTATAKWASQLKNYQTRVRNKKAISSKHSEIPTIIPLEISPEIISTVIPTLISPGIPLASNRFLQEDFFV